MWKNGSIHPRLVLFSTLGVILLFVIGMILSDRKTEADALLHLALHEPTLEKRSQAASQLALLRQGAQKQLRILLEESNEEVIQLAAIDGLDAYLDRANMPALLKTLESPSENVRQRASDAIRKLWGDHEFVATDPLESRQEQLASIRLRYDRAVQFGAGVREEPLPPADQ
jgi:HEAT repeat protein